MEDRIDTAGKQGKPINATILKKRSLDSVVMLSAHHAPSHDQNPFTEGSGH